MYRLKVFRCLNNHEFEELVHPSVNVMMCLCCDTLAKRVYTPISYNILFKAGYMESIGEWCGSEMEYYNKRAKALDKIQESFYTKNGGVQ